MSWVRSEVKALTALAAPVVAAQVGMMMFGIVDVWMVGRLGSTELAAVALADVCLFGSVILGLGLVMGIDPIVAQAHGAGAGELAGRALQRGLIVACLAAIPLSVVWLHTDRLLVWMRQDEGLAHLAQIYADMQVYSIAPFLLFAVQRQYLQGRGLMTPPLWIILAANLANVAFNEVFIFGRLGFPALGLAGAGLATGLTRTCMALALAGLIFKRKLYRGAWVPWSRDVFRGLGPVLAYGLPVAIQFGLEVWAFLASTLFAGWLGETSTAAHVIVLKLASLAFMVPLGISIASATRVGNLLGARDRPRAQNAAWVALAMGGGVMILSALVFVLGRGQLGYLFSKDPEVVALAATIFPIAAAFALFDGTQVVGCGILRGMGTTRPAAWFNVLGYWVLALPIGYTLAMAGGLGLRGIWWGLCLGLFVVAGFLVAWIAVRGPATLGRLAID